MAARCCCAVLLPLPPRQAGREAASVAPAADSLPRCASSAGQGYLVALIALRGQHTVAAAPHPSSQSQASNHSSPGCPHLAPADVQPLPSRLPQGSTPAQRHPPPRAAGVRGTRGVGAGAAPHSRLQCLRLWRPLLADVRWPPAVGRAEGRAADADAGGTDHHPCLPARLPARVPGEPWGVQVLPAVVALLLPTCQGLQSGNTLTAALPAPPCSVCRDW
jgi:hypothetical protein